MNNSFTKKTMKDCPLSSLQHAVKRKRKTVLESDHCENSEIYCTIEDFLFWKATISIYEKSPNEVVNTNNVAHRRCSNECDSILMCKDELKRENISVSITLQTLAWPHASEVSDCFHTSATIKHLQISIFP